ncbi:MAG: gluconate 2-dehydrogenase subunit 3 family protein, partial [Halieaceae bacterium]
VLTAAERASLESIAEALVPGARVAGVAHFVDSQLAASAEDCLLMLKYLGVPPDGFRGFYQGALAAAGALAQRTHGKSWDKLPKDHSDQLIAAINGPDPEGWEGPPAGFFTFVLRADACDVAYGTEEGLARAGMPNMAHIKPETRW